MKNRYLLGGAIGIILLVGLVMAVIPPPPANQNLGIYDSEYSVLGESDCRTCHDTGVPDAHHLLVPSGEYGCTDCHPTITNPDGSPGGITMERACEVCHMEGGIVDPPLSANSPHHATADAIARQCSACHGSYVDDFDDGHYIPTYEPSLVTPDTSFKIFNETSERYWGGCEACHQEDLTAVPFIQSNYENHHDIQLDTGGACSEACHRGAKYLDIRTCEDCHGVESLHNIQYDFANTNGTPGYGHVGDNWDCNGCHAFWDAGTIAPLQGPITPEASGVVSSGDLVEGQTVTLTVIGNNFINGAYGAIFDPQVVISDGTNTEILTLESATDTEIVATWTPQQSGMYVLYVVKSDMRSRSYPIGVGIDMSIISAVKDGDNVIITGTGFGDRPPAEFGDYLGVTILHQNKKKTVELPNDIVSWSDTEIVVNCPDASSRDLATIKALFGSASAEITGDEPTPKPTKTPKPPKK
jgi:hypothetical protein